MCSRFVVAKGATAAAKVFCGNYEAMASSRAGLRDEGRNRRNTAFSISTRTNTQAPASHADAQWVGSMGAVPNKLCIAGRYVKASWSAMSAAQVMGTAGLPTKARTPNDEREMKRLLNR